MGPRFSKQPNPPSNTFPNSSGPGPCPEAWALAKTKPSPESRQKGLGEAQLVVVSLGWQPRPTKTWRRLDFSRRNIEIPILLKHGFVGVVDCFGSFLRLKVFDLVDVG